MTQSDIDRIYAIATSLNAQVRELNRRFPGGDECIYIIPLKENQLKYIERRSLYYQRRRTELLTNTIPELELAIYKRSFLGKLFRKELPGNHSINCSNKAIRRQILHNAAAAEYLKKYEVELISITENGQQLLKLKLPGFIYDPYIIRDSLLFLTSIYQVIIGEKTGEKDMF